MPGRRRPTAEPEKYGLRLDKYRRRVRLTYTVGAGLGTLAALLVGVLAGSLLDADPPVLKPLFITLFLITGGCLSAAYIQFEWAVTKAERKLDEEAAAEQPDKAARKKAALLDSLVPAFPGEAKRAEFWWSATLTMVVLTVVAFLIALWWSVAGTPTGTPGGTPTGTPTGTATGAPGGTQGGTATGTPGVTTPATGTSVGTTGGTEGATTPATRAPTVPVTVPDGRA
jgi:F0F1-type ATP synthase assembly protein I